MELNATKMVAEALLGEDGVTVKIKEKEYVIMPPTIKQIVGAGKHLANFGQEETQADAIRQFHEYESICKAVSWFVYGTEENYEEFINCTLDEVLNLLEAAFSLIGIQNFVRLSTLAKNVKMAIAKQR